MSIWRRGNMKKYLRGAVAAATALSLAAALAACGDSSGDATDEDVGELASGSSALKCGMANGKEATGDPVKIRALTTANGGINGRPIDYAYEDDALNQQKAAQIAAKFAADPSIVALAGDATFIGCGAANPIYEKAGLYSITGTGVPQSCFESSNIAPVNAGPRMSAVATVQYLDEQGKA